MINFLIDKIFMEFGGRISQQTVGIPLGTNCAPLLADLFLHSYEADIVQELLRKGEKKLAQSFNYTFRYIDDVLSPINKNFSNFLHLIYPVSHLIRYSRTCNSYRDLLHRSVLLKGKLLNQGSIETRLRSILKKFFGRYHHLTFPYRLSVTTMANDICRP